MIKVTCDRCGAADVPMKQCGIVEKYDYCASCLEAYNIYIKKLDGLQEKLSIEWDVSSKLLKEEFLCIK